MYKLIFFVPEPDLEPVKEAVFKAGAGKIGDYDACAWQVLGAGQFRPLQGSQPYIGELGRLEHVNEWRVEMVCDDAFIRSAVAALKNAHPYETVAYDVLKLVEI